MHPTETEKAQHTAEQPPVEIRHSTGWTLLAPADRLIACYCACASIPDPASAVPALVALAERIEWLATAGEERGGVPYEVTPGDWGRLWNQARAALALAQGGKR